MDQSRWFLHPIAVFTFSLLALGLSLFLYIYWYIEVSAGLKSLIARFDLEPRQVLASETWVVILVLSILVAIILLGIFTIFVYNQKTLQLYQLQRNFINNFTHELKTPVTSIRLYLETFERYDLGREDQLKYIRYMLHDIGRLSGTINRILELARIENRGFGEEFADVDLVQTTESFLEKNRHLFKRLRISVHNAGGKSWTCRINRSLFEMLLTNLAINSMKYTTAADPWMEIRFTSDKKGVRIDFKDNGIGFEKREAKKIFKKFYRIRGAAQMAPRGSGLGLHLVQSIARIHKGWVTAQSEGAGKGAVFTLVLPVSNPTMEKAG